MKPIATLRRNGRLVLLVDDGQQVLQGRVHAKGNGIDGRVYPPVTFMVGMTLAAWKQHPEAAGSLRLFKSHPCMVKGGRLHWRRLPVGVAL